MTPEQQEQYYKTTQFVSDNLEILCVEILEYTESDKPVSGKFCELVDMCLLFLPAHINETHINIIPYAIDLVRTRTFKEFISIRREERLKQRENYL